MSKALVFVGYMFMPFLLFSNDINITGTCLGNASIKKNNIWITLKNCSTENLSYFKDERPFTGGKRIMLYFNANNKSKAASECGFIYKKTMILKKVSSPGFFNITLDEIGVVSRNNSISIVVPKELFNTIPSRIWTFEMKRR